MYICGPSVTQDDYAIVSQLFQCKNDPFPVLLNNTHDLNKHICNSSKKKCCEYARFPLVFLSWSTPTLLPLKDGACPRTAPCKKRESLFQVAHSPQACQTRQRPASPRSSPSCRQPALTRTRTRRSPTLQPKAYFKK